MQRPLFSIVNLHVSGGEVFIVNLHASSGRTRHRTMKVWRTHWAYLNTCRLFGGGLS